MGRGDNRRTGLSRRRKQWRRKKARLAAKITGGSDKVKEPKAAKKAPATKVRKADAEA